MSGLHLVKKGREHRKMDLQRDFTVASPAEFVTRFGGNRVIEKVRMRIPFLLLLNDTAACFQLLSLLRLSVSVPGADSQQWYSCSQVYALDPPLVLRDVSQ